MHVYFSSFCTTDDLILKASPKNWTRAVRVAGEQSTEPYTEPLMQVSYLDVRYLAVYFL